MIIGSTKEDLSLEKRVALTLDAAKNIIGLGLNICIEKNVVYLAPRLLAGPL